MSADHAAALTGGFWRPWHVATAGSDNRDRSNHAFMSNYREILPPPCLRDEVECFWTTDAEAAQSPAAMFPHMSRVLPDGCVDIIFDLATGEATVIGTMTTAFVVPAASLDLLAVRFRPGAASRYLPMPVHELTDGTLPLSDVWRGGIYLAEEFAGESANRRRLAMRLAEELTSRRKASDDQPLVSTAVRAFADSSEDQSVADIAGRIGVSRQHLTRQFKRHVGVGPKEFARVMRFRRLVAEVNEARNSNGGRNGRVAFPVSSPVNWALQAQRHGYYDQSHLLSEFKRLCGVTPVAYFGR